MCNVLLSPGGNFKSFIIPSPFDNFAFCHFKVDKEQLMAVDTSDRVRGVIITTSGHGSKYDFMSRYFAPWVGIPEDPVTGSAHTVLAPYWSGNLNYRTKMFARQCSSRGGELGLELRHDIGQLVVKGVGTVTLDGTFYI